MDLPDREQRILAHVRAQVAKGCHPRNEEIAMALGVPVHHVVRGLSILIARRLISTNGSARFRRFRLEKVEPVRVARWTCNRCGGANDGDSCVNGCRSGQGYLSTAARVPAFMGAQQGLHNPIGTETPGRICAPVPCAIKVGSRAFPFDAIFIPVPSGRLEGGAGRAASPVTVRANVSPVLHEGVTA